MPISAVFQKLSDSEIKDANVFVVVSIGHGLSSSHNGSEAEHGQSIVDRLNQLTPENGPRSITLLNTGTLQRHNFDRFLLENVNGMPKGRRTMPVDEINKNQVMDDKQIVKALKSGIPLANISSDEKIDNEIAAMLLATVFKPNAKMAGEKYCEKMQSVWSKLEGYDLCLLSGAKKRDPEVLYLEEKEGKVAYTIFLSESKVIHTVTNIKAPSPFDMKNLACIKSDIWAFALKMGDVQPLRKRKILIQDWDEAIEEFNQEQDWDNNKTPYNKYARQLKILKEEYAAQNSRFRKAVDAAIKKLSEHRQFDKVGERLRGIVSSYHDDLLQGENPIIVNFVRAIKDLDFGKIGKIACRNYILEGMAHMQSLPEKTFLLYPGGPLPGLEQEFKARKIPLIRIIFKNKEQLERKLEEQNKDSVESKSLENSRKSSTPLQSLLTGSSLLKAQSILFCPSVGTEHKVLGDKLSELPEIQEALHAMQEGKDPTINELRKKMLEAYILCVNEVPKGGKESLMKLDEVLKTACNLSVSMLSRVSTIR